MAAPSAWFNAVDAGSIGPTEKLSNDDLMVNVTKIHHLYTFLNVYTKYSKVSIT